MSAGGRYNGYTLEELRSLVGSADPGGMIAAQQSFAKLADLLEHVQAHLTSLQSDLPNWWTGAAADQASSLFGHVVGQARQFQGNAQGAATALGTCAQVVLHQQSAMHAVPEATRPESATVLTDPQSMSAADRLAAMQQEAEYQRAHEQAVQVVNGMAAQYVETRSQLDGLTAVYSDNFQPVAPSPSATSFTESITAAVASPTEAGPVADRTTTAVSPHTAAGLQVIGPSYVEYGMPHVAAEPEHTQNAQSRVATSFGASSSSSQPNPFERTSSFLHEYGQTTPPPSTRVETRSSEFSLIPLTADIVVSEGMAITGRHGSPSAADHLGGIPALHSNDRNDRNDRKTLPSRRDLRSAEVPHATFEEPVSSGISDRPHKSPNRTPESTEEPIFGPSSSVGTFGLGHDSRRKRPAYLKEPKSTWLSENAAAPPNGILFPENDD